MRERIASPEETLHAPHLLDLEVVEVLRRYVSNGVLDSQRAALALMTFGRSISIAIRMSPCWLASDS